MSAPSSIPVSIDELLAIEQNAHTFQLLKEQIESSSGVVPFVGAGLSIPYGIPGWPGFLRDVAQSIDPQAAATVQSMLERDEFEEAAEFLHTELGQLAFADRLDAAFGTGKTRGRLLSGLLLRVADLTDGPVITTNFDQLLEQAFVQRGYAFEQTVWGAKVDLLTRALHQNAQYLLKIHGDILDRTDRIFTLSDYARCYGGTTTDKIRFDLPLPKLLAQVFRARTMLFLGCSLGADRTLKLLRRVAEEDSATPIHYALVELPATREQIKSRSRFLSDHRIRPLWFPKGRFEALDVVFDYLVGPS